MVLESQFWQSIVDLPPSVGATFFFLSLVSNAFLAHYNAPGVFNECRAAELEREREDAAIRGVGTISQAAGADAPIGNVALSIEATSPPAPSPTASPAPSPAPSPASSPLTQLAATADDGATIAADRSWFMRLTSASAAEEVNQLFQIYIESVPSFEGDEVKNAYAAGFREGYTAGYNAGVEDGYREVSAQTPSAEALPSLQATDAPSSLQTAEVDLSPVADNPRLGLEPFRNVVIGAFAISSALFLLVAGVGFSTFGDASDPLILNSYASSDPLINSYARVGILLAVLFEFPLLERPFRLTCARESQTHHVSGHSRKTT